MYEEKTSDLPADGAVDVVIVSSGLKMLINKYLHELNIDQVEIQRQFTKGFTYIPEFLMKHPP